MVKILAVDDDPDITISVKEGLERQGFEVDIYNDPVRAVGEFRPNTYRLALLDMSMPGMGGFEVFREIRKRDPGIKICFVTAFDLDYNDIVASFPASPKQCVIKKPLGIRRLVTHIRSELGLE